MKKITKILYKQQINLLNRIKIFKHKKIINWFILIQIKNQLLKILINLKIINI